MKKSMVFLLLVVVFISCKKENNKTSSSDCRTSIEASYEREVYMVNITNKSEAIETYRILFPDGGKIDSTQQVLPHETIGVQQGSAYFKLGTIAVRPNRRLLGKCPFGSVQVNL